MIPKNACFRVKTFPTPTTKGTVLWDGCDPVMHCFLAAGGVWLRALESRTKWRPKWQNMAMSINCETFYVGLLGVSPLNKKFKSIHLKISEIWLSAISKFYISLIIMWHLWLVLVATVLFFTWLRANKNSSTKRICILVLGDIGRSPRMQYHALSCAQNGYEVDLIGFGGKNKLGQVQEQRRYWIFNSYAYSLLRPRSKSKLNIVLIRKDGYWLFLSGWISYQCCWYYDLQQDGDTGNEPLIVCSFCL